MGERTSRKYFHPVDYAILVASLVLSLMFGLYQAFKNRRIRTTSEYLMGSRLFSMIPVAMSLTASFISSIALIGFPAEVYYYGAQSTLMSAAVFFATLLASVFFVPLLHPLNITSAPEYLEMRYKNRAIRLFGTAMCVMKQLLYSSVVVYGQAAALEATTGLPTWATALIVTILATAYTACGGMKAVIWTDVFQLIVMVGSLVTIIVIGSVKVGGPRRIWQLNDEWGRFFLEMNPSPYKRLSLWSMVIAGTIGWTTTYSVSQTAVQRYCAVPSMKTSRRSMFINSFGIFFFCVFCSLTGMVVFAYYTSKGCDPYLNDVISNKNQILPFFVMDVLSYPGLPGLFVSGLFSGSLSTISSCISSMCAVIWTDLLKPYFGENLSQTKQVTINQFIAVSVGIVAMGMTFLLQGFGGSLAQISASVFGMCTGPYLGIFLLGAIFPWANWIGALLGGVTSLVIMCWMMVGQVVLGTQNTILECPTFGCNDNLTWTTNVSLSFMDMSPTTSSLQEYLSSTVVQLQSTQVHRSILQDWFYSISYIWFGACGLIICLLVGTVTSCLSGATDPNTVEKRYLLHFMRKYYGKEEEKKNLSEEKVELPLLTVEKSSRLMT